MTNQIDFDPYFDDEDEENEVVYRQLLRNHERLPPYDPATLPVSSLSERCTLCSRVEAENILKTNIPVRSGHFIVRPNADPNHPYSMSVVGDENNIYHFQIGQISDKYVLGSLATIDMTRSKLFPSLTAFLEYYSRFPIQFQNINDTESSILLRLYPIVEITRF